MNWEAGLPKPKQWPRITIVTPSFNQGRFLEETIRSVLLQEYPSLQYIVIDGGSTDNSVAIIEKYKDFLDFWVSEGDKGQADAINKGLAHADGEILGYLNSDDFLLPGALFTIAEAFLRDPEINLICGLRRVVDENSAFKAHWIRDLPTDDHMRNYCCVAQETVYWRRKVWQQIGPFDKELHYALDYEYWLHMIQVGYHFHLIPAYLAAFRVQPESKTSTWYKSLRHDLNSLLKRYFADHEYWLMADDLHYAFGQEWLARYTLLEDLCNTHLFDSPELAVAIVRLVSAPFIQCFILVWFKYRIYVRPRLNELNLQTRLLMLWQFSVEGFTRTLDAIWCRLRQGYALRDIERVEATQLALAAGLLPYDRATRYRPDVVYTAEGWHLIERDKDGVSRWAQANAQIVIPRSSGKFNQLTLELEPGPQFENHSVEVEIVNLNTNRLLATIVVNRRIRLQIPFHVLKDQVGRIAFRAKQHPLPTIGDSRLLYLRVFHMACGFEHDNRIDEVQNKFPQSQELARLKMLFYGWRKPYINRIGVVKAIYQFIRGILKLGQLNEAALFVNVEVANKTVAFDQQLGQLEEQADRLKD